MNCIAQLRPREFSRRKQRPERWLARMLAFVPRHELGVVLVPPIIFDVGLLALDLPHMPHGMAVTRGARLLQREIYEASAQQH